MFQKKKAVSSGFLRTPWKWCCLLNSSHWHLGIVSKCWEWSQAPQLRHVPKRSYCRCVFLTHHPVYFFCILGQKIQGLSGPGFFFIQTVTQRRGPTWTRPCAFVLCRRFCWLVLFWGWVFFIALKKTWNLAELEIPESSQLQLFCCALLLLHPQWRCQGRDVVHTSLLQYCTKAAGQSHFELDLTENTNCILILACPCSPVTLWSWVNSAVSLDVALTHGGYRTL